MVILLFPYTFYFLTLIQFISPSVNHGFEGFTLRSTYLIGIHVIYLFEYVYKIDISKLGINHFHLHRQRVDKLPPPPPPPLKDNGHYDLRDDLEPTGVCSTNVLHVIQRTSSLIVNIGLLLYSCGATRSDGLKQTLNNSVRDKAGFGQGTCWWILMM